MGNRTCSVEGCAGKHSARGYCAVHYQHWHRWGDPLHYAPPRGGECSFEGCTNKHESRGYCSGHASQLRRGAPLAPLGRRPLGAVCMIDGCPDAPIARGWCAKHYTRWRMHGDPLKVLPPSRLGTRKYALDEHYFDAITDERRAYWLGFITADGGVIGSALRIELAGCDEGHLRRFAADIQSEAPVTGSRRGCALATVNSWRITEALARLGITERKSATVQPWAGPAALMPHYWRGMVDGDGSISRNHRGEWSFDLNGSEACVREFARLGRRLTGSRAVERHLKGGCWRWATAGSEMAQVLARELYGGAEVALPRKAERAAELIAVDFAAARAAANVRRSAALRDAWATGRHPRSRVGAA